MPHPKKRSKLKLQFPIFVYAFFALLFAGIIVYFTATLNPSFARFWNSIMNFFRKLFGLPAKCYCGEELE